MNPKTNFKRHALCILAASLVSTSAYAEPTRITVQIENVAPMQATFTTPVWVGLHDGVAFDTYNGNTPANSRPIAGSNALESICEDGSTAAISSDFTTLQPSGQQATIPGPNGPIAPGEMTSFSFIVDSDDPNTRYFSYASMVLPSNDFCISNGSPLAHPLFNEAGEFIAENFFVAGNEALDAGTEVNDEIPGNTAFFGQAAPNTGTDEGGNIGTLGSDINGITGFLPQGSGGILDDPRFREGDFSQAGYSFLKFKFSAAPAITENLLFSTFLLGKNEVPVVRTRAIGLTQASLIDDGSKLNLLAAIARLPRTAEITMAHLHLGAAGENGPVVANLLSDSDFSQGRLRRLKADLEGSDLVGPLLGQPLDALIAAIQEGRVYVNIHTERNPAGELRGQLTGVDSYGY